MYSGGKDSGLALSKALEVGKAVSLIHCLDSDKNESLFHEQKQSLIDIQAQKLRIPIIYVNYKWWVRWDKITKLYRDFCRQGVKYVVFGDLNSLDNIIIQVKLCKSAGMIPCFPLYLVPYDDLITELENRKIKSIITTINHPSIDTKWLGEKYDRLAYQHFKSIGIDPFGENGEFHTTLVDADCFDSPIQYNLTITNERRACINSFTEDAK